LDAEYKALAAEIKRNSASTEFNGTAVIGANGTLKFQIGYKNGVNNQVKVSTVNIATASFVVSAVAGSITTLSAASAMLAKIDKAIDKISSIRAKFGAAQNRLESTLRNNANIIENQSAARSRILDADFARETANLTRTQILQQAGTAMLAQANKLPQNVLSLLG